ncbi:MAG: dipeptide/oligopeptide/nickel ABC transporter permease/ATP-binding protein, partial [Desulfotomaculales bacterium]
MLPLLKSKSTAFKLSLFTLALVIVCSTLAPLITGYDPTAVDLSAVYQPPSPAHIMGTDEMGRDVFTRLLYGGRVSLLVGLLAIIVSTSAGSVYGAISGFSGQKADAFLMRLLDALMSIPNMFLMLAFQVLLGTGIFNIIIVIGFTSWMQTARMVRAEVLSLKERDFVKAAVIMGTPWWRIITKHLLPQCLATISVVATIGVGHAIMSEAALSFLGLGIPPHRPSWGNMLMGGQNSILLGAWWIPFFPGLAVVATVLSIIYLGDYLQERLNPRQRVCTKMEFRRKSDGQSTDQSSPIKKPQQHKFLKVSNLSVHFPTERGVLQVVRDLSFELDQGKLLAVVGESGCGKSVTGKALLGLVDPPGVMTGTVELLEEDILKKSPSEQRALRGKTVSMIFQDPSSAFDPVFTVGSQMTEALFAHGLAKGNHAKKLAVGWLTRVGFNEPERIFNCYPFELSGGMRQRAFIAMVMALDPKLIVADEPTTALDMLSQIRILALLKELQNQAKCSIILITHDLGAAAGVADEVL